MNWTGGRLQQHQRKKGREVIDRQKQYFAKERMKLQKPRSSSSPFRPSFLSQEHTSKESPDIKRSHEHSKPRSAAPASARSERHGGPKPTVSSSRKTHHRNDERIFATSRSKRKREDIEHSEECVSSKSEPPKEPNIQEQRRRLLARKDWVGVGPTKTLLLEYPSSTTTKKLFGKRRKTSKTNRQGVVPISTFTPPRAHLQDRLGTPILQTDPRAQGPFMTGALPARPQESEIRIRIGTGALTSHVSNGHSQAQDFSDSLQRLRSDSMLMNDVTENVGTIGGTLDRFKSPSAGISSSAGASSSAFPRVLSSHQSQRLPVSEHLRDALFRLQESEASNDSRAHYNVPETSHRSFNGSQLLESTNMPAVQEAEMNRSDQVSSVLHTSYNVTANNNRFLLSSGMGHDEDWRGFLAIASEVSGVVGLIQDPQLEASHLDEDNGGLFSNLVDVLTPGHTTLRFSHDLPVADVPPPKDEAPLHVGYENENAVEQMEDTATEDANELWKRIVFGPNGIDESPPASAGLGMFRSLQLPSSDLPQAIQRSHKFPDSDSSILSLPNPSMRGPNSIQSDTDKMTLLGKQSVAQASMRQMVLPKDTSSPFITSQEADYGATTTDTSNISGASVLNHVDEEEDAEQQQESPVKRHSRTVEAAKGKERLLFRRPPPYRGESSRNSEISELKSADTILTTRHGFPKRTKKTRRRQRRSVMDLIGEISATESIED